MKREDKIESTVNDLDTSQITLYRSLHAYWQLILESII